MTGPNVKRKYQETHPWITFIFDARNLNFKIWLLLGEAKSKFEHIKGAPLLPEVSQRLYNVYLAKGALATTAIEGNTLSEKEVEDRIKGKLTLPPSKEYLGREIDNVVNVLNHVGNQLIKGTRSEKFTVDDIKEYNRLILKDLPIAKEVVPGEFRKHEVGIARYRGAPPEDLDYLMNRYVNWLNDEFVFPSDQKEIYGILKAIMAHLYFVWIHPFGDGNGRTARLVEFQILLSVGAPAMAAQLLSNHYNQTRSEYYRNLDLTSRGGEISDFLLYALQGFVDGLRTEIELIQGQQISVHWINHIHNSFRGKHTIADERQKELMLELSKKVNDEFLMQEIRHISPRIAEMYAGLSDRTFSRDIDSLVEMNLILKSKDHFSCNIEILQQHMAPVRVV